MQLQLTKLTNQINIKISEHFLKLQKALLKLQKKPFFLAGILHIQTFLAYRRQDTGQTLFTACTTLKNAYKQYTPTSSASSAPSQGIDISTANFKLDLYLKVNLQILFAFSLGQENCRRIAPILFSFGKLLEVPWDTT